MAIKNNKSTGRGGACRHGIVLLALAALQLAAPARAAPLEVYGRLPRIEDIVISPDGSRLAFVKTEGDSRVVVAMGLAEHAILGEQKAGDQKVRGIEWADNDHLLIMTSATTMPIGFRGDLDEWYQLEVYDLRTRHLRQIPDGTQVVGGRVMNAIGAFPQVRHLQDQTVLFVPAVQLFRDSAMLSLLRVDLGTNLERVVRTGSPTTRDWMVDETGQVVAEEYRDEAAHRWSIALNRDGHWREAVSGTQQILYPDLLCFTPKGDALLVQLFENGASVWKLLSLTDGTLGPAPQEYEPLDAPIVAPFSDRMTGGSRRGDTRSYVFFDRQMQERWQTILDTFAGERVHYQGATADLERVVVRVEGARHGYQYVLVDLRTHQALPLGTIYEGVAQPLETRRVTYAAADGLQIPAYLTLPRGKPPTKLPLIVLPHGGPAAHDTADFDWWTQALADQGYAVLRPNYRGSALGWKFLSAGFGEWGRKMQTDLSDGVRYLVREGIADPARVCIVGASYGGYAALAGPTLDAGVYRCAAAVAGIADVKEFLAWVNEGHMRRDNDTQRYWDRFLGVSGPNDPAVEAISPIRHIDAIKVPVLLVHGRDDTVVPFRQSQLMYDALHDAHREVQLVALAGEDHWLSRSETRLQMLKSVVAFLREHNPPDP